jgi:uncharacterized protein Yka (UPF0111/DUF47 family)
VPAHRLRQKISGPARRRIRVKTVHEDLLERLHDRMRHLRTFVVAAEQAASEALALVRRINEEQRGEVEAHYNQLADMEEKLDDVRRELGRVMGELEKQLAPDDDD